MSVFRESRNARPRRDVFSDDRKRSAEVASGKPMDRSIPSSRPRISRRAFLATGMSALGAPLFWRCGFSSSEPEPPQISPHLTAMPESPTLTPTIGLSQLGLDSVRDALLYVPASYSPEIPMPLFVALHGATGGASNWASYHARAEARGMILLLPNSRDTTWDLVNGGFGLDVTFIDRALYATFERCNVDPAHLALAGFSDGASYALSLGVSNGDLFTHLVAYSPGFFLTSDPIVGKPDVYISHGRQDPVLPVTASRNVIVPALRDNEYEVTYEEFEGVHQVPAAISEAALDWFLEGA